MKRSLDIQGHRGARGLRPENTLPGFELALDLGVDTLELDLHLTADDVVVVWHDPQLDPKKCRGATGETLRDLSIGELAEFTCDLNPDPERFPEQEAPPGGDYRIPTLASVLDLGAPTNVRFNIETKQRPHKEAPGEFETLVVELVRARGLDRRVTIQSFEHGSLWAVRAMAPEIRLAALTEGDAELAPLAQQGAAIWSPAYSVLNADRIRAAHALSLAVIPWTVNDANEMRALVELGVDGLITDRPDIAVAIRG